MDEELHRELKKLTLAIKKSNSLWWSFLHGATHGLGVIVGTALLFTLLVFILTRIEGWAYIGRYAHNIMEMIRSNPIRK